MTLEYEAAETARDRYASRLIEDYDGDRYDEDEYGYDATARQAFVAGAVWASQREPSDTEIKAAAKAMIETRLVPAWWWATNDVTAVARDVARAALLAARNVKEEQ